MGGRGRVYAEFLLACIFLSLISWANKHRLSPDGQVRASLPPVLYLTELVPHDTQALENTCKEKTNPLQSYQYTAIGDDFLLGNAQSC